LDSYESLVPKWIPRTPEQYAGLSSELIALRQTDVTSWREQMRELGKNDLVWILSEILSTSTWKHPERPMMKLYHHPFSIDLCRRVQFLVDETLRIVSRGHLKSTTVSFGLPFQVMVSHPNCSIGEFSYVKALAEDFVSMIMDEMEQNDLLYELWPEFFFEDPAAEAKKNWSSVKGFTIKRTLNYATRTMTPVGIMDSSFQGKRFSHQIYDDVVCEKSTNTPEMVGKANDRWEKSLNLGYPGTKRYYVGTFYAMGDTYHHMIGRGVKLEHQSCYEVDRSRSRFQEETGIPKRLRIKKNKPVLFSRPFLERQEELMGPTNFGIQMLGCPVSVEMTDFDEDWICYYQGSPARESRGKNIYIFVDPAGDKGSNKHSKTAMSVWAMGPDQNRYLVDGVLDTLNLAEKQEILEGLVRRWMSRGGLVKVYYEKTGWESDAQHMEIMMEYRHFRYEIETLGTNVPKVKRIQWLIPLMRDSKLWFPRRGIPYTTRATNQRIDIVEHLIEDELLPFPNAINLDFIDCCSRMEDPGCNIVWPMPSQRFQGDPWRDAFHKDDRGPDTSWQAS